MVGGEARARREEDERAEGAAEVIDGDVGESDGFQKVIEGL